MRRRDSAAPGFAVIFQKFKFHRAESTGKSAAKKCKRYGFEKLSALKKQPEGWTANGPLRS
jgi:hypothetical protein